MTISIDKGYNTDGVTAQNLPIAAFDFPSVFRVVRDNPGELILTNLSSPYDRPEKIRTGFETKKDVYKASGVNPSFMPPSLEGVSLLVQASNILSLKDDADPHYRIDLPIKTHSVITMPLSEFITPALIMEQIGRSLGVYWDPNAGSSGEWRFSSLVRGALKPTGL